MLPLRSRNAYIHWLLHVLELLVALVVLLPLVARVRVANQALTAHLRCVQKRRGIAVPALWVAVVGHHEPCAEALDVVVVIGQTSSAVIAANGRRPTREERGQMLSTGRNCG